MTSMEEQLRCFYLDSELNPASDMLRQCVRDKNSAYRFNCEEDPMRQVLPEDVKETARMNDISIQRGFTSYNIDNITNEIIKNTSSNNTGDSAAIRTAGKDIMNKKEGFINYRDIFITDNGLGESQIPKDKCPEGYGKCPITGKCIQQCVECVYNDKMKMKSREFNEADPCFPEGIYNGITNEGYIKCTCGKNNRYCSDNFTRNIFTAEGMMIVGQKIIANTGLTRDISDLFNINHLY